jgi:hypothetical protein
MPSSTICFDFTGNLELLVDNESKNKVASKTLD